MKSKRSASRWLLLAAALVGVGMLIACRDRQAPESSTEEVLPFPFPVALGATISTVKDQIRREFGTDEGLESADLAPPGEPPSEWAWVRYDLERGTPTVSVRYGYRVSDGKVWSIRIGDAAGVYNGEAGGVRFSDTLPEVRARLGKALREENTAPILFTGWWTQGNLGYEIEFLNAEGQELGYGQDGEISSLEVFMRDLAPPGYPEEN